KPLQSPGQGLCCPAAFLCLRWCMATMEEMVIWEQHTVTLSKDPQWGFGFAVSGGRDRPNRVTGDTAVVVSDVVPKGPAVGRLQRKDHIVMVNGLSMDNVLSSFAVQTLKTCGKIANIVSVPCWGWYCAQDHTKPCPPRSRARSWGLELLQGYDGDSSSDRSSGHHQDGHRQHKPVSRRRSSGSDRRGYSQRRFANGFSHKEPTKGLALVSGFKRLPRQDVPMKPIRSLLGWCQGLAVCVMLSAPNPSGLSRGLQSSALRLGGTSRGSCICLGSALSWALSAAEYGLKLGSQLFIKHIVENGLAAKGSSLQEGDLILKINGVASGDMSLADTQKLIEQMEGTLTLLILRDHRQFLVNIPDIEDSESDSSHMDGEGTRLTVAPRGRNTADCRAVHFVKAKSIGLRLAGGNNVGIFVSGVQDGSPAASQGVQEGDQILQVNNTSFQNLTREEAVEYLMSLPPGEEVTLWTQNKQDTYRKVISSSVGDSFYIRTHFDFEKDTPSGLSFFRGDVFHVLDTLYQGRLGSWLAVRMGRDLQEQDKGIIPNQRRAEQIASLESVLKTTSSSSLSGARAEFWKLRGLRGAKKLLQKSREDLSALTKQGHYPPYERVVLKEASFKRPVVILGPITDIAMQKLSTELPELFEIAREFPLCQGTSKVIKMDSVQQIAGKGKHALLDITPSAVERLNYVQYYPVVVFCEPESRQGIKAMRQWLAPDSRKSSRRLYAQARRMKKHCSHLFTATVSLSSSAWYEAIKDIVRMQQNQPVWTAAEQVWGEDSLDLLNSSGTAGSGYLTCDSRANSDYEDTDGEADAYTDGEAEDAYSQEGLSHSSEPAQASLSHGLRDQVSAPTLQHHTAPCTSQHQVPPSLFWPLLLE
uniref:Uncharacterized protein n=1 Tax=Melopsittacus undulatus TaxID=13146 RepID=A0A8V5GP79_MELUD